MLGRRLQPLAVRNILASGLHAFLSSNRFTEQRELSRYSFDFLRRYGGLRCKQLVIPTIILPLAARGGRTRTHNDKQNHNARALHCASLRSG